jgi:hypothetical protein
MRATSDLEHASTSIITSHYYVRRLRADIGADIRRNFLQANYNWSDQQW